MAVTPRSWHAAYVTGEIGRSAKPSWELRTERLTLRSPSEADVDPLVVLRRDEAVRQYLGGPVSLDQAVEKARSVIGSDDHWVVVERESGRVAGLVSLTARGEEVELSYELSPAYWKLGYAYEACSAVLTTSAERSWSSPIIAVTQRANERSKRLLGRLGFQHREDFVEHGEPQVLFVHPG